MARLVRMDDNAVNILKHIKNEMKKQGIEKTTFSETVRYLYRKAEKNKL